MQRILQKAAELLLRKEHVSFEQLRVHKFPILALYPGGKCQVVREAHLQLVIFEGGIDAERFGDTEYRCRCLVLKEMIEADGFRQGVPLRKESVVYDGNEYPCVRIREYVIQPVIVSNQRGVRHF
ncbi:hypothetical protein SDC9_160854 [bioreactor metagenome]|uniref:Uncharacterized protein n=1 Tax=bioreactor metagenome TaxID=1076179 RepID=A0A645FMV8_9ZZZZ